MMDIPEHTTSSLSEFDTSSDSDWLDISSRASEDNDSVASFYDSDREDIYDRPASRRSVSSLTSSRSGVVEGWEGLIDDTDDATPAVHTGSILYDDTDEQPRAASPVEEDPEEERVKAGLEQSMMTTLSSPRSNSLSNSMQTSVVRSTRDLRLSFPDPLTSSRDQSLHSSSYEDISAPEPDATLASEDDAAEELAQAPAPMVKDPGLASTPEVLPYTASAPLQRPNVPASITPDFYIAIYGSSSPDKYAVVDTLLAKWADGAGFMLSCSLLHATSATTRVYIPKDELEDRDAPRRMVSIVDKTDNNTSDLPPSCQSLAVILLPSAPSFDVGMHTLYLPVVVPSTLAVVDVFASTDDLLDAEQQWESLGITSDKLTSLSDWSTAVIDQEKLNAVSPAQVDHALQPLLKLQKPLAKRTFSTNAILLAILSIVIGYIVEGTVCPGLTPMPSWGLGRPQFFPTARPVTSSTATSLSTLLPNSIVISPTAKDMQVSLINSVTSLATTTTIVRQVVTKAPPASTSASAHDSTTNDTPTECECGCGMVSWSGKVLSTDLILRPAASASALSIDSANTKVLPSVTPSVTRGFTRHGKGKATSLDIPDTSLYALSTRIAGSISEYLEVDLKALLGVSDKGMQELMDALQVLYESIHRQTIAAVGKSAESLRKLHVQVQEEMKYRNTRAKARAREIKEKGRQYLSTMRETFKARTEVAKEHAKVMKENMRKRRAMRAEWRKQAAAAREWRKSRRAERRRGYLRSSRVY
ncbi:hypothetical protein BXZ70DRAFT_936302 [Cristinia sonorae]|uniref:Uncharacterized protein n=1 Tax=Cristinia sonorae TaxID=1940300 RepID=A0A8K0UPV0_9AGAR|nr:hypothetical protein BXZ70DRAFT_936302 [Cristinia sonorae]